MNIPFPALRAFAAVAQLGSFTAAAQALHLTQPAISKAVRELEALLEIPLLERHPRQVRLTEAGSALFEHARAIFALERAALEDLRDRIGLEKGRLVVGASTTVGAYWLPPYLAEFIRAYPGITVNLVSGNTDSMARRVLDYEVDLALVEGPVADPRLACQPWLEERLTIVAPPGQHLHKEQLEAACWIVREEGSGTSQVTRDLLRQMGITPRRTAVVTNNTMIVQMVMAGAGVGLVPCKVAQPEIRRGSLEEVELDGEPLVRELNRIYLHQRPASPARTAFERILTQPLPAVSMGQ